MNSEPMPLWLNCFDCKISGHDTFQLSLEIMSSSTIAVHTFSS